MSSDLQKHDSGSEHSDQSLSAQAHNQAMDYLREARKSSNPAFTEVALRMAEETSEHHRSQSAKIHPALVAVLATLMVIAAMAGCWFAFTNFTTSVAWELSIFIFAFVLVLIALYARLSGALSETGFSQMIDKILTWLKDHSPLSSKTSSTTSATQNEKPSE